jgi:two-component system cell cycle response regulator
MAGATAHEMNQPLMVLLGSIELLEMNEPDPELILKYVRHIKDSGKRISDIVKKIQIMQNPEVKPYLDGPGIINFDQKVNILAVEDSDKDFKKIKEILENQANIAVSRAVTQTDAIQRVASRSIDLIILSHELPDGESLDFMKIMKEKGMEIPVVVIMGQGDEMMAAKLIQAGVYDYINRVNVNKISLIGVVTSVMEKYRLKKEVNLAIKQLTEKSTKDKLTGVYNRRYFLEALEREVGRARRYETALALCILDLDHFKQVNATHGHPAGDMVLSAMGKMLQASIRESDIAGRYGGEEFGIIFPHTDAGAAGIVSERFRDKVAGHRFGYNATSIQLTISIGIVQYEVKNDPSYNRLLEMADQALYRAKKKGRNRSEIFR